MQIRKKNGALSSLQILSTIVVVMLMIVTFAYIGTVEVNSSQISNLQDQVNALQTQIRSGEANVTSLQNNVSSLKSTIASLPAMHEKPTTRNIRVEWFEVQSLQDRFFLPTITVNQGDTLDITFIANDTDAHTFTLESPYDFQINATVPGTGNYLNGETFTTNATNNSPGVKVYGTPGNISATGSFVARYPGIFEYFCVYHVAVGMFGYLIVLPNTAYSNTTTTSQVGQGVQVSIALGASTNTSFTGYVPDTITVVLGVNNTVIWTNNDNAPHTVTADNGSFSSGNMNPDDTFSWTFTEPGTYTYHCSYHPWMRGTVIVKSG